MRDPRPHPRPPDGGPRLHVAARAAAPGVISRSTLAAMRRVLHGLRDGWLLDGRVRAAARMVAADAHRCGAQVGQMLDEFEREWAAMTRAWQPARDDDLRPCAARLATLSVREFHVSRAADRTGAARAPRGG